MSTEQEKMTEYNHTDAGTLLREKRESLGLTQQQVAQRLKLKVTLIQKLESNDCGEEQVATFIRGYYRSYAKVVSLDENLVLAALDHAGDAQHEEQEMQSFSRKRNVAKHNSRVMKVTWGIFAVIFGISSVWWWQNQQQDTLSIALSEAAKNNEQVEVVAEVSEPTAIAPVEVEEVVTLNADSVVSASDSALVAGTEAEEANTDESLLAAEEVIAEPVEPDVVIPALPAGHKAMELGFSADCWIQVKDANGKILSSGLQKPGQQVSLTGKAPFKIILGAPEGVTMTFASEPVDLSGYTSGKVAKFTLP
ncbi:transcriptional regulator [Vibrio sp. 10N.286.49.B3]|uniref:RodZ domain-containing protein n=1 Tax=Vibrio sp. 10N.286.49.B3 TaxID=1880855 RepID=UPI000C86682A|nr:RodZ domain-containing protein [Vibrio sp. 10N.286.49.B3]PMH37551.1 transcriptional regulator [Vibrio sp. 10N.286.49.B3]